MTGFFKVKDDKALLPLSNSVLKFLPADSLLDLPVTDKTGKKIGTFSGMYTFEKMGEISGTKQRHSLFQYTDVKGKMQSSSDRLLLDSFGVSWKDAVQQRGFRLPADRINLHQIRETCRLNPELRNDELRNPYMSLGRMHLVIGIELPRRQQSGSNSGFVIRHS